MKRLALIVALLTLCLVQRGSSQDRTLYRASVAAVGACAAADLASTHAVLAAGGRELNPAMRSNPYLVKGIIVGATLAGGWLIQRRWPSQRRGVAVSQLAMAGLWCSAGAWNYSQLK